MPSGVRTVALRAQNSGFLQSSGDAKGYFYNFGVIEDDCLPASVTRMGGQGVESTCLAPVRWPSHLCYLCGDCVRLSVLHRWLKSQLSITKLGLWTSLDESPPSPKAATRYLSRGAAPSPPWPGDNTWSFSRSRRAKENSKRGFGGLMDASVYNG